MNASHADDLIAAAESGDIHQLREALLSVDKSQPWLFHRALYSCAAQGWKDGVGLLLRKCAPSAHAEAMKSAAHEGHIDCMRVLAKRLSPSDFTNALVAAAIGGRRDCIDFLVPQSNLDDAIDILVYEHRESIDALAHHLNRSQMSRIVNQMPGRPLPVITVRLKAFDDATRLENQTVVPAQHRPSKRL